MMIEVDGLTKNYGRIAALSDIRFKVGIGEVVGFLGPNGAGKSTTMNIISGYSRPTEGTVLIDGYDVADDPIEVKKRIGYLPEVPPLYGELTVDEFLRFVSRIKGIEKKDRENQIANVCHLVDVADVRTRLIGNLSRGYKQRVGLAQALLGDPSVLILDEPTIGLDPQQIIEMRDLIKFLSNNRTILLSSHILTEVSAVCSRVLIINKGRIVGEGTPSELSRKILSQDRLLIRVRGPADEVVECARAVEGVASANQVPAQEDDAVDIVVEADGNIDIRDRLCAALWKRGFTIRLMRPEGSSLEEAFLQLTSNHTRGNG